MLSATPRRVRVGLAAAVTATAVLVSGAAASATPAATTSTAASAPVVAPRPTAQATSLSSAALTSVTSAAKPATPPRSATWRACSPTLAGVTVDVLQGQRTVTIVNGRGGTTAAVSFWVRTESRCGFWLRFATTGRVGYNGITPGSTRKQGSGTTPTGTYSMTEAFGLKRTPGTRLLYRRVGAGDFWVEDNQSRYYNNYRNQAQGGFRWKLPVSDDDGSERLTDYPGQYDYALVINFNRAPYSEQKARRGAGIFLHVNGPGATAGCVSLPQKNVIAILNYLRSGDRITITR